MTIAYIIIGLLLANGGLQLYNTKQLDNCYKAYKNIENMFKDQIDANIFLGREMYKAIEELKTKDNGKK